MSNGPDQVSNVGAVSVIFGLFWRVSSSCRGGFSPCDLGLMRAVIVGLLRQISAPRFNAVLPYAHDPVTFAVIMGVDNFAIAMAWSLLVAYMSSLTKPGFYTATQ